jgi:cytoskeletal protein CcmA (bactofilin family)
MRLEAVARYDIFTALLSALMATPSISKQASRYTRSSSHRGPMPNGCISGDNAETTGARADVDTPLCSLLGSDVQAEGVMSGTGELMVGGRASGLIACSTLRILAGGMVDGEIECDTVEIAGTFKGRIAARLLRVLSGGCVEGEVRTEAIAVAMGASLVADVYCAPPAARRHTLTNASTADALYFDGHELAAAAAA